MRERFLILSVLLALLTGTGAHGAGFLDTGILDPTQLGSAIPQNVADQAILLVGSYAAHRPYSGAVANTTGGLFDLGIETTLVKIGDGLPDALTANGIPSGASSVPAIPMIKLHLRKSLGTSSEFGLSALTFRNQSVYGADLKFALLTAEEGPSLALRLLYTWISIPMLYIDRCTVLAPELVVSQPLSFAESWIGIGGRYASGLMKATVTTTVGPLTVSTDLSKTGSSGSAYAFTGVKFRIPGQTGLRLGVEGSYDTAGYHTMGTFIGVGF
jgi:hypothetical protein